METYQLEYLFIAETHNGTIIKQTPDDRSLLDPLHRNSFYDVLNCGNPIKRFSLVGKGHLFTVDLTDGHIEIDGKIAYPPKSPPVGAKIELIYYRQVQQSLGYDLGPEASDKKQKGTKVRYYIGWQANHNGKNVKFELGVD